jgi:predicted acylesterase/phospholipase RssA
MFAAWEVGVLKALREELAPDLIVGASAGAWNGWALAGGASLEDLEGEWRDPRTADLMRFAPHGCALIRPGAMYERSRELFSKFRPRVPFGLTMIEVPSLRPCLVKGEEVTWRHLAATSAIPLCFPPVRIDGLRYVDGGLRGALPLWAAQQMGATRALALNCLTNLSLRMLRAVMRPPQASAALQVSRIEPPAPLGSLRDAAVWSAANIDRWIEQGMADGNRARSSITM